MNGKPITIIEYKNDEHDKMGVTTMTFRINKNNKVICGKKFTPADKLMPLIEHRKQKDPAGGSIHIATMEKLINHFTGNAKTPPGNGCYDGLNMF